MFCPNCGTQTNGKFCPNCGTPLSNPTPANAPNNSYQQPVNGGSANPINYQQPVNGGYANPANYQQPVNNSYANPNPNSNQQPVNRSYANPNPVYVNPNNGYQQPVVVNVNNRSNMPVAQLRTNRALWKMILFSVITFGIYPLVVMCHVSTDINTIATRYDNKRTMHFALLLFIVAPITLGIGAIVWEHNICGRMKNELLRRAVNYSFGPSDFWLWGILGSLIVVGPFIFMHKFFKAMNMLCADFNING